jgi:hypothetical protein
MHRLILLVVIAIGLGACGKGAQETADQNAGENLTAESIVSNDVTAIDAVTGDAANMAADVDMNYGNLLEENAAGSAANTSAKPVTRPTPGVRPRAVVENSTSTAVNAE